MTTSEDIRPPRHVAYRVVRENITALAGGDPAAAGVRVPSCPQWTVYDMVAHVAGHCVRMSGETVDWTGARLDEVLRDWQFTATIVEPRIADGEDVALMLMDTFTHELDLRVALGVPAPRDHPAYPWGFDVVVGGLSWSISMHQLPALRLVCEEGSAYVAGSGRPAAVVRASRYDLYRSLTGRRSAARIRELAWSADPGQWLAAFFWGPFSEPSEPAA